VPEPATSTRAVLPLEIDGLTYAYPNADQPALRDIDLHLAPGELVLLAGRSACGKSTLREPPAASSRISTAARSRAASR
jgi:ABC-type multidrug transport system fused ATPase/permease subunit